MTLSLLLHPVALLGLVATAMCLCIYLFLSSKRELHAERYAWSVSRTALEGRLQRLQEELGELRSGIATPLVEPPVMAEARPAAQPVMSSPVPMEERTRAEALALRNAGFSAERIAPVLQLPENEVELLLKIQRLTA